MDGEKTESGAVLCGEKQSGGRGEIDDLEKIINKTTGRSSTRNPGTRTPRRASTRSSRRTSPRFSAKIGGKDDDLKTVCAS